MSVCSNTLRALSRSRSSTSKTLLPFLYYTATLEQWRRTGRPVARRHFASRSRVRDGIPFEDENLPPAVDGAGQARKTTLTGPERAAFQKLYRKFKAQEKSKSDKDHVVELDQIADEYYEDDEEPPPPSADKVDKAFDEVLKGAPQLRASRSVPQRPASKTSSPKQDLPIQADESLEPRMSKAKAEALRIKNLKLTERSRIDTLLQTARTDREIWQILEREVFDQVRKLNLDRPTKEPKPKLSDQARILFQNYPYHLITAVATLRTTFPSSILPLSVLPTIKALGRSAYALGATTTLYKHLLRCAWLQHASYSRIDQLLMDMNNGAIEFDSGILEVLDSIIKEHEMARLGQLGKEMQLVYGMERFLEGIKQIRQWRGMVAARLGVVTKEEKREPQRSWRDMARGGRGVDLSIAEDVRYASGGETGDSEMDASRNSEGNLEDIPLVEGVGEIEDGLLEAAQEFVDEKQTKEAELLVQDLGLDDINDEEDEYRPRSPQNRKNTIDEAPEVEKVLL